EGCARRGPLLPRDPGQTLEVAQRRPPARHGGRGDDDNVVLEQHLALDITRSSAPSSPFRSRPGQAWWTRTAYASESSSDRDPRRRRGLTDTAPRVRSRGRCASGLDAHSVTTERGAIGAPLVM